MSTPTANLGLKKGVSADNAKTYLVTDLAGSLDTLDSHDHSADAKGLAVRRVLAGTEASRPASPSAGFIYVATDTHKLWYHDGSNWKEIDPVDAIANAVLSGTVTGTYTLGGTPTITSPTVNGGTLNNPSVSTGTFTSPTVNTSLTGSAVGTGANQVAAGNHTHSGSTINDGSISASKLATLPLARIRNVTAAAQNLGTGSSTVVTFDTEDADTDGMANLGTNNERLSIQTAGYYLVIGHLAFSSNNSGYRQIAIEHLPSTKSYSVVRAQAVQGQDHYLECHVLLYCNVGDSLRLRAFQDSGGTLTAVKSDATPALSALFISP